MHIRLPVDVCDLRSVFPLRTTEKNVIDCIYSVYTTLSTLLLLHKALLLFGIELTGGFQRGEIATFEDKNINTHTCATDIDGQLPHTQHNSISTLDLLVTPLGLRLARVNNWTHKSIVIAVKYPG